MAKIDKIINIKVEGVRRIKELEENLKKLRKQQRDNNKQSKSDAESYSQNSKAIKSQSKELRDLKKAMSGANDTAKKSNKLQKSMTMAVIKGAAAFSILVTAFRRVNQAMTTMIGTFTEFEFTMAKVKAVSGANSEEFKKLSASAQELGRSTFFTASEVANLQLNLSKLGFTTDEILAATQATINLSIATGSDLARAATVAGNAIRGFQLDASEAGRVVDVMAVAFTSSALDIEKWQTSMTKVAPIAAMAGFSIEETTAIMAKLSDTGIEASIAGTSLRNIFLKMQDPTSELTRKVGHTIHSLDDMLRIFKQMQDEGTDLADILTFMDVRQVAAFGTMLEGADDIQVLVDKLENAEGAGQRMADTVGDTLQGSILKVKSAFQGLAISIVQNFGGALKETLKNLAKWLNELAKNPQALAKIGRSIQWVIKILASYVIGSKLATLWTKNMATGFLGATTAAGAFARSLVVVRAGLRGLATAIATTGIGLLVILLGELAAAAMFSNDEILKVSTAQQKFNKASEDGMAVIKKVQIDTEKLIAVKKELNKIIGEEGDLTKLNAVETEKYNRKKDEERRHLKELNKHHKKYSEHLLTEKSNIDDITESTKKLMAAMTSRLALKVYEELSSESIKQQIVLERATKQLVKHFKFRLGEDIKRRRGQKSMGPAFRHSFIGKDLDVTGNMRGGKSGFHDIYLNWWLDSEAGDADWGKVAKEHTMFSAIGMDDMDDETRAIFLKHANDFMYRYMGGGRTDLRTSVSELFSEQDKELQKFIESFVRKRSGTTGFVFSDLYASDDDDDGDDGDGPMGTDAINTMTTIINKHLKKFYEQGIQNEEEYRLGLLEAQKSGLMEYINQETDKDEKSKANVKLLKLQKQIDDEVYRQLLTSIERERQTKKEAAQLAVLDGTAQKTDLYGVLNAIDEEQNAKILKVTEDAGRDITDIQSKINKQQIKNKQDNFKETERLLTEEFERNKLILDERLANEQINEIQHKAFMLLLEEDYLNDKKDLYLLYGENVSGILNELSQNEIDSIENVKDAISGYLSDLGDLGGAMQDLAGDEEKLSGLRKAGVVITQAAATAEKVLAIANTMTALANSKKTLSEVLNIANTPAYIGANAAKTASNITTAASGFISTISSAAASIPFPFNIFAIGATLALIFSAVRKIRSSFGGGSGSDPSSSTGSQSSSGGGGGGMMSLMTFGGRHTTVGQIDSYADGGMVHGKSHAQGGEKFAVGGRVVELEGGEAVINKRSTSMFRSQLSAMNYAGGGVKFADGGVTNIPSFAQTQFQVDGQRQLSGVASQRSKVVVVEADITKSQNTVSAIEAEAAF